MASENSLSNLNREDKPAIILLARKLRAGELVGFLGAGINFGSKHLETGLSAPTGRELAVELRERFIPGQTSSEDLATVASYVVAAESRSVLEGFIRDRLTGLEPTTVHAMISRHLWKNLFTTNYDTVLETQYSRGGKQRLKPVKNDREEIAFSYPNDLPYIKLHGCVTIAGTGPNTLIITREDWTAGSTGRQFLYDRLKALLAHSSILFIGYSLKDRDFQDMVFDLQRSLGVDSTHRAYAVVPDAEPVEVTYWQSKRITILRMTAEQFFTAVENIEADPSENVQQIGIAPAVAAYPKAAGANMGIFQSIDLVRAFEIVHEAMHSLPQTPTQFYSGNTPQWVSIRNKLDAKRTIQDSILEREVIELESKRHKPVSFALVTGAAGSGISTLLMRLAYETATTWESPTLFYRGPEAIFFDAVEAFYKLVNRRRVFVFVDNAADSYAEVAKLIRNAELTGMKLTLVAGGRRNEWNNVKQVFGRTNYKVYEVGLLDDVEITRLLDVLGQHRCLDQLEKYNREQQEAIFAERAAKVLIVALREATSGFEFRKIIESEYSRISTNVARQGYLWVCAMHALGSGLRIGTLHRLMSIPLAKIGDEILDHCEGVILAEEDVSREDTIFRARHRYIAEEIIRANATTAAQLYKLYFDLMLNVDLGFPSDRAAFEAMVTNDELVRRLGTQELRHSFFDKALERSGRETFVLQHYAINEKRFGDLAFADELIGEAIQASPKNPTLQHTRATILFERYNRATNPAMADVLFRECRDLLERLIREWRSNSYAYNTLTLLYAAQAARSPAGDLRRDLLEQSIEIVERGIARCDDDEELSLTKARILRQLHDDAEALALMRRAHQNDKSAHRTAYALARLLLDERKYDEALKVCRECLPQNPSHRGLNRVAAECSRMVLGGGTTAEAAYLKSAFDPQYIDYRINLELARCMFESGQLDEARTIFDEFYNRNIGLGTRGKPVIVSCKANDVPKDYQGTMGNLYNDKGYVRLDGNPDDVFFPRGQIDEPANRQPSRGDRVKLNIGFNYLGPIGLRIRRA